MQSNNYNVGLPPADKDQANWPLIKELLKKNDGRDMVSPSNIKFSSAVFKDLIRLRRSSPLFRLTSSEEIINRVKFHNTGKEQQIGLIVMSIDDSNNDHKLDRDISRLVVIFNTNTSSKTVNFQNADQYQLHPIQLNGTDDIVKKSTSNKSSFCIPPLTTSVYIKKS
jgi:hypothetical protein